MNQCFSVPYKPACCLVCSKDGERRKGAWGYFPKINGHDVNLTRPPNYGPHREAKDASRCLGRNNTPARKFPPLPNLLYANCRFVFTQVLFLLFLSPQGYHFQLD